MCCSANAEARSRTNANFTQWSILSILMVMNLSNATYHKSKTLYACIAHE